MNVVESRPDSAEAASLNQELEILAEAIATLPDRRREIFILRRYHNLSYRKIAERLGVVENYSAKLQWERLIVD